MSDLPETLVCPNCGDADQLGTAEVIYGLAAAHFYVGGEIDHDGYTEMWWDSAESTGVVCKCGWGDDHYHSDVPVDEDGNRHLDGFDMLVPQSRWRAEHGRFQVPREMHDLASQLMDRVLTERGRPGLDVVIDLTRSAIRRDACTCDEADCTDWHLPFDADASSDVLIDFLAQLHARRKNP